MSSTKVFVLADTFIRECGAVAPRTFSIVWISWSDSVQELTRLSTIEWAFDGLFHFIGTFQGRPHAKKKGGPPTPRRPAIVAFLLTPVPARRDKAVMPDMTLVGE